MPTLAVFEAPLTVLTAQNLSFNLSYYAWCIDFLLRCWVAEKVVIAARLSQESSLGNK